jgi:hypothetical protein
MLALAIAIIIGLFLGDLIVWAIRAAVRHYREKE